MTEQIPLNTLHLFDILDKKLIELLQSLTVDEWQANTVAKKWKVKDIAAHLLDGNLRGLSTSRDKYFGEKPENINSYQDLVNFLNHLNMTWTQSMQRLSPQILIYLIQSTGKLYTEHLQSLPLFEDAIFSVAWAGQQTSPNWFHIAREYTEKFLHQQQIRDAVNKPGIMTQELFIPFMDTLMFAFPHTFRETKAANGTVISLKITSEIGKQWNIIRALDEWHLTNNISQAPEVLVTMSPETAWKLFSKSWTPENVMDKVIIEGNMDLGKQVLKIVAVMA